MRRLWMMERHSKCRRDAFDRGNAVRRRAETFTSGKHSFLFVIARWLVWHVLAGTAAIHAEETSQAPNRIIPAHSEPSPFLSLPDQPTDQDIQQVRLFSEPLLPIGREPTAQENRNLARTLEAYSQRGIGDDLSALEQFVAGSPDSPWVASLMFNMGMEYYRTGWYSKALACWEKAWPMMESSTDRSVKPLADRAVGELALMYARIGRMADLSALLDSIKGRVLIGPGQGKVRSAQQGLGTMRRNPEIAFRCGPCALDSIIAFEHPGQGGRLLLQ